MASSMTVNDLPDVVAALHRRAGIRWKEGREVLANQSLYRLDGITPAIMLTGVMRARGLGLHGLVPDARFDHDERALVGVRMTPRIDGSARPLDGLFMTLIASEGLDQTLSGLRALRDTAAPGDTLSGAIEKRGQETVADLTAVNTLIHQVFGASLSLEQANAEPADETPVRAEEPAPTESVSDAPTPPRPPQPSIGL